MKGNEQVIEALNAGLTIELTAINTYFIHSKMLSNWGLGKLASYYYKESIEEMKHADEVIERILFLDGIPAISRYDVINVGQTPQEMIEIGMALETKGASSYNEGVKLSAEVKDTASRELMERMVVESEQSIDWAEAQLDLIGMTGLENYLAQQMRAEAK